MLPRYHQHLVTNVSIIVEKKVNKLGHEDLLLAEGSKKGVDAGGITSLRSGSGRFFCIVEALFRPNINAKCAHEFGCSVDSATSPINYTSLGFCVTGERGCDAGGLLNLADICEHRPSLLNGCEHYLSHLIMVVPVGGG